MQDSTSYPSPQQEPMASGVKKTLSKRAFTLLCAERAIPRNQTARYVKIERRAAPKPPTHDLADLATHPPTTCGRCAREFRRCGARNNCIDCEMKFMDPFLRVVDYASCSDKLVSCTAVDIYVDGGAGGPSDRIEIRMMREDSESASHQWPCTVQILVDDVEVASIKPPEDGLPRRDLPLDISRFCRSPTRHKVSLQVVRKCVGIFMAAVVRVVERTDADVMALVAARSSFSDAVDCVKQRLNTAVQDVEVMTSAVLSLACPLSLARIRIPVRGFACCHLQCFDLKVYVERNRAIEAVGKRWQCPVCSMRAVPDELVVDGFVEDTLNRCDESETCVTVQSDGSWAPLSSKACTITELIEIDD